MPIDVGCSDYTLKFTILPKPYILQPLSSIINSQLKIPAPTMILFDEIGNKDTNGNYSIDEDNFDVVQHEEDGKVYFTIHPKEDTNVWVAELHLGRSSFDYELRDGNDGDKLDCLREVYKGLTIYEFNYDFVMGMRLFDSEMIASQLLSGVLGLEFGVNFQLNTEQILIEEQVAHWVKEVLDEEDIELSNCYYTFNNKAYDEANIHAEALKAKGYQINTYPNCVKSINPSLVTNILDELGQVESKIERTEIIKRAINEITATLPQPGTQYAQLQGIKVNFVCNLIEQLMRVLVNTILTPKIVMLIQINEIIMGGNVKDNLSSINLMQFLRKIKNLLVDIIREVANLIISKLFEFVMELLLALFQEAGIYIIKEQMDVYYALIRKMIEECGGIGSLSWGNSIAGSSPFLDIDYADIISNTENNTPIKSDC